MTAAFAALDELSCYLDSAAEPNNVHLEAWLPGRLAPGLLRSAVARALVTLPDACRRQVAPRPWRRGYLWEHRDGADVDPVTATSWRDEAALVAARAGFLATAPELDLAPAFRLLLASGPDRDCLILNAHHAAFDGRSCELLLRHIAAAYSGGDAAPDGPPEHPHRTEPGEAVADPVTEPGRPVRVAAAPSGRRAPGYGHVLLPWPGIPARAGGQRATVNDLLVAALIATIAGWNAAHGRRTGPVRISMPVSGHPAGEDGAAVGNLSRISPVTAMTGPDLLGQVTAQTSAARGEVTGAGSAQALLTRLWLPATVKRRLYRAAVQLIGASYSDTSLLTNLGNITDPPSFRGLVPDRMWFSTSAHMPRGLSVGAISVGGQLSLCFRHRYALLSDAAAREFATRYAACLTQLSA